MYSRIPEDEPLGSKHVEDMIKIKILVNKDAFCWFMKYDYFVRDNALTCQ
jgi:hypothetical protein